MANTLSREPLVCLLSSFRVGGSLASVKEYETAANSHCAIIDHNRLKSGILNGGTDCGANQARILTVGLLKRPLIRRKNPLHMLKAPFGSRCAVRPGLVIWSQTAPFPPPCSLY
jgi:hypothetical protein